MVVIAITLIYQVQEVHQAQVHQQNHLVEQEQQGEINMDGNQIIETMTPKNFLPTIKDNYIKGWEIWWKIHKSLGRFLMFSLPILVLELIILALIKHFTGMEFKR